MYSNKRFLFVKLWPVFSLNSSNIRMFGLIKGILEMGGAVDLLTIQNVDSQIKSDMSKYPFMSNVNIIGLNDDTIHSKLKESKHGVSKKVVNALKGFYHKLKIYDYTVSIAKRIKVSMLPLDYYDYIIGVSDPKSSYVAIKRLIKHGLKYKTVIEYWGDPFFGDITLNTIVPSLFIKSEEKKLLKIANKIVYTNPFTLKEQQKLYSHYKDRMICIPTANAFPVSNYRPNNDVFTMSYIGAYQQTVRNLLPFYNSVKDMEDCLTYIVGDSDIRLESNDNIIIKPRMPALDIEKESDLFVCILNRKGHQIPGKVYHCASTNRAVLVILDGDKVEEMKDYLVQFNRFYLCYNNEEDIRKTIKVIKKENRAFEPCSMLEPINIAKKILE